MRRLCLLAALAAWLACQLRPAPAAQEAGGFTRDVTFIVTSDCHYDAFENEDRNERNRQTVEEMNAITDRSWPKELGGEAIQRPRGVLVLGDVIDDGDRVVNEKNQSAQQWAYFLADFGLDGTDGLLKYPVYEGWGNHDGPPEGAERFGFSFQAELRKRNLFRKDNGWLTGLSENGLHYSWTWDDVHFAQLNIYPADKQNPQIRYNPTWHDPQNALSFLKQDLAENVGQSGRPVVLMSHCGFDTDWWHPDDWRVAYEAMKPYNVILYMYGHSGTGLRQWAPPGETWALRCVNTGQTENGFFVVQLKGEQLRLAYRVKEGITVTEAPDGTKRREWSGGWGWRWPLEARINVPTMARQEPVEA